MPRSFAHFLHHACLSKKLVWKISDTTSVQRTMRRGTPQGCPLSILLFQVIMAPLARALSTFMKVRCRDSQVLLYADDRIILTTDPTLLQEAMAYAYQLLASLDFEINVGKSTVAAFGVAEVPQVILGGEKVPMQQHPDVLGSTIPTSRAALVPPNALPLMTTSRSALRWIKARERLSRLARLPVTFESKELLWRTLILPVISYDSWTLLPSAGAADTWSALVIRSIYSAVRGHKDAALLAALDPHQLDILSVLAHQLAKEAIPYLCNEPIEEVFVDSRLCTLHTPITALAKLLGTLGFTKQVDGIWHEASGYLIEWPPASVDSFLHHLRDALRCRLLLRNKSGIQPPHGAMLSREGCQPVAGLTLADGVDFVEADAVRARHLPPQEFHLPGQSAGSNSVLLRPTPGLILPDHSGPMAVALQDGHNPADPIVIGDSDHGDDHIGDAPVTAPRAKRRRWDLNALPPHLVLIEDTFSRKYKCLNCSCTSAIQARSPFFAKHWNCQGESVHVPRGRRFLRKAELAVNVGAQPNADEILNVEWYQFRGALPKCVVQPAAASYLHCTVCASKDRPCNRKRFIVKHLRCLATLLQPSSGTVMALSVTLTACSTEAASSLR
eukprot:6265471-Amphidinium_carterae.2